MGSAKRTRPDLCSDQHLPDIQARMMSLAAACGPSPYSSLNQLLFAFRTPAVQLLANGFNQCFREEFGRAPARPPFTLDFFEEPFGIG
jgi:hypothetical protein